MTFSAVSRETAGSGSVLVCTFCTHRLLYIQRHVAISPSATATSNTRLTKLGLMSVNELSGQLL